MCGFGCACCWRGLDDVVGVVVCRSSAGIPVAEDVEVYFYFEDFVDVMVVVMMVMVVVMVKVMIMVVIVLVYLAQLELQTSFFCSVFCACSGLNLLEPSLLSWRPDTVVVCVVEASEVWQRSEGEGSARWPLQLQHLIAGLT